MEEKEKAEAAGEVESAKAEAEEAQSDVLGSVAVDEPPKAKPAEAADKAAKPDAPKEPDWKDQYARLLAEFDNFRKRTARDRENTYHFAEADILKDILPTVDNLSLALEHAKNKEDDFVKGVQLVFDALMKALKEHGAEPFDSVGKALDPEKMEAIATLPSPEVDEGKVSIESKKGWMLNDKVLRAAQVVVSSGKPAEGK